MFEDPGSAVRFSNAPKLFELIWGTIIQPVFSKQENSKHETLQ